MNSSECRPVRSSANRPLSRELNLVDEVFFHPLRLAIRLQHRATMANIDRSWLPVESHSAPVPELERKDVGRGTDLEHHRICTEQ